MTQDTGCAPLQLLPKRESRGGSRDAHTVGRKPKCYQWDNLGRGVKGGRGHVTSPGPPAPAASGKCCFPSDPSSPEAVENNRPHLKQWEGRTGTGHRHLKKLKAIGFTLEGRCESCWLWVFSAWFPGKHQGCANHSHPAFLPQTPTGGHPPCRGAFPRAAPLLPWGSPHPR